MSAYIDVWPFEPKTIASAEDSSERTLTTEVAVAIESSEPLQKLWYRGDSHQMLCTEDLDAFAIGLVFYAMSRGKALRLRGNVSPSLLANLCEFQAAWALRRKGVYKIVDIIADNEREAVLSKKRPALAAFSGGLDSCFTMLRHKKDLCGRLKQDIQAGLFVQGFDIPLEDNEAFARASARARTTLSSVQVPLICISTNHKILNPEWDYTHILGLASALTLLKKGFHCGIIGGTLHYGENDLAWGSNATTDHLLSSGSFKIIHDGAGFTRLDKFKEIANWPEAYNELRLCYSATKKDENCCQCWKCMVNILRMRALGLALPPTFPKDISDSQIAALNNLNSIGILSFENVLNQAKELRRDGTWMVELEKCIARNKLVLSQLVP